jgi:hypothetical protein
MTLFQPRNLFSFEWLDKAVVDNKWVIICKNSAVVLQDTTLALVRRGGI